MKDLLEKGIVCCHPFILGELACGDLKNRSEILSLLRALSTIEVADYEEVLVFIEERHLTGKGSGYIDVHLLASAVLSAMVLWTADRRLAESASALGVCYKLGDAKRQR